MDEDELDFLVYVNADIFSPSDVRVEDGVLEVGDLTFTLPEPDAWEWYWY